MTTVGSGAATAAHVGARSPAGEPPPTPWLLRRVNQRYRAAVAGALRPAGLDGLPPRAYWGLAALAAGAAGAGGLVDELGVSKQAVSKLVDLLVAGGHVERRENEADRRRTDLLLTERGRRTAELIGAAVRRTEEALAAELGAEAFGQLRELLGRLAAAGEGRGDGEGGRP